MDYSIANFEAKLKRIATMPLKPVKRLDPDAFPGFRDVHFSVESTLTWKDKQPGRKPYIKLKHFGDNQELAFNYAISTFTDLHTNMSIQTVVKMLVLAYLRDDRGCHLFAPVCQDLCSDVLEPNTVQFDATCLRKSFTANLLTSSEDKTTVEGRKRVTMSLCFIAASLLRTAIIYASDYTRTSKHLATRFKHFYGYELAVSNYAPTETVLERFKSCLTNNEVIQHTLYMLLYAGEENKNGGSLKDFLYRRDTQCKGMHVFGLFMECLSIYNVTKTELLQALRSPGHDRVIKNLQTLFNNCVDNTDQELKLKMWKYARIFDHKFFKELQTKKCVDFVAILAYMIKIEETDGKRRQGDVMNITMLANLPQESKNFARRYAMISKSLLGDLVLKRDKLTESMESRGDEVQGVT